MPPGVGVVAFVDAVRAGPDEHGRGERQQVRLGAAGLLPPAVEMAAGDDVGGEPLVVEVEQGVVVDDDVAPARPVLKLLDVVEQPAVVVEERVVRLPVALHQGVADEQVPAQGGVDRGVVHPAGGHQRQPVQGHLLEGDHGGLFLLPVRFAVGAFHQVRRECLGPFRFDARDGPRPQPGRLDEFGGHQPARRLPEQRGAREDREPGAPRPLVLLLVGVPDTDVGQQAGEQRQVDVLRVGRGAADGYSEAFHDLAQLAVDVLPLPYPQVVQEVGPAQPAELVAGQLLLLFPQVFPHVEVGEEVGLPVGEAAVFLRGGLLRVDGTLPRILDGQRGRDDHDLADAPVVAGRQHHAGQPGVEGNLRQFAPQRGQPHPRTGPVRRRRLSRLFRCARRLDGAELP